MHFSISRLYDVGQKRSVCYDYSLHAPMTIPTKASAPPMRPQTIKFLILTGTILLVFLSTLLILVGVTFFLNQPIGWYHLPTAAVIALAFGWFIAAKYFPRQYDLFAVSVLCLAAAFAFAIRFGGYFYDASFDGQTYHTEAIVRLAGGWNPVQVPQDNTFIYPQWLSFYPKGPWIASAALVKFLATINPLNASNPYKAFAVVLEQGKAINVLVLAAALCFALAALLSFRKLRWHTATLLALLLVFNPISTTQIFSEYVDGQLGSCLLILVSLLILLYRKVNWPLCVALIAVTIMIIDAKLTGSLYLAILGGGFIVWYYLTRRHHRLQLIICLGAGCFLGGVVAGYNPFVTQYLNNLVVHHDPFYPTTLSDIDGVDAQVPITFINFPPWKRLLYSILVRADDPRKQLHLKIPFTISSDEFTTYQSNQHTGGMGPLFGSVCLLVAVVTGLLMLATLRQKRKIRLVSAIVPLTFLLVVSVLIDPEAWWQRYVPQLWLIPILIVTLVFCTSSRGHIYGLSYIAVALLCFNLIGLGYVTLASASQTRTAVLQQMATLQQLSRSPGPLYVSLNGFPASRYRLVANDVNFLEVGQLPCSFQAQQQIYSSQAAFCVAPPAASSQ